MGFTREVMDRRALVLVGLCFQHASSRSSALRFGLPAVGSNAETVHPGSKMGAKPRQVGDLPVLRDRLTWSRTELPGVHTADPWDTSAHRGGLLGYAMRRSPAAPGHDHRPVSPANSSALPRSARSASRLDWRARAAAWNGSRPRRARGQVARPSAYRRSPGFPLPPRLSDECVTGSREPHRIAASEAARRPASCRRVQGEMARLRSRPRR
jgi:hypothetical protein